VNDAATYWSDPKFPLSHMFVPEFNSKESVADAGEAPEVIPTPKASDQPAASAIHLFERMKSSLPMVLKDRAMAALRPRFLSVWRKRYQ
jgi:hypothetical protein